MSLGERVSAQMTPGFPFVQGSDRGTRGDKERQGTRGFARVQDLELAGPQTAQLGKIEVEISKRWISIH